MYTSGTQFSSQYILPCLLSYLSDKDYHIKFLIWNCCDMQIRWISLTSSSVPPHCIYHSEEYEISLQTNKYKNNTAILVYSEEVKNINEIKHLFSVVGGAGKSYSDRKPLQMRWRAIQSWGGCVKTIGTGCIWEVNDILSIPKTILYKVYTQVLNFFLIFIITESYL